MANGMKIEGKGTVQQTFLTSKNTKLIAKTICYHVPNFKSRLINPQRLFNKPKGVSGKFTGDEDQANLKVNNISPLHIEY